MKVKFFTEEFNNELLSKAKLSPRLRYHYNLHNNYSDPVQRIAIGLQYGSYIPPHYHALSSQWEFFHIIKGHISLMLFSHEGIVLDIIDLGEGSNIYAAEIPPMTCHTLICKSPDAIIYEWKQGPFDSKEAKIIPRWAPLESYENYSREYIIQYLLSLSIGERVHILTN
ncbi:WbuC family cupin fold metalloprotein [Xenorhabdus sp. DI]|uniref:WbuC family cupin fold metalloprotein n=1 Tax=Xenorhabdus doucetiae TaxID=351671 RepID=UPI00199645E1|nr:MULTISPECIES: WbuC family cupin fold metalloprotein [unclassified Xenorhabdus]MBD2785769.1 WbuC family cupin fold metalloprotein [Xenorhabdus sp. 3]MBD2789158.1 WbuC family cupin fold metalloprotein [Xenorhabdus sp. DI]